MPGPRTGQRQRHLPPSMAGAGRGPGDSGRRVSPAGVKSSWGWGGVIAGPGGVWVLHKAGPVCPLNDRLYPGPQQTDPRPTESGQTAQALDRMEAGGVATVTWSLPHPYTQPMFRSDLPSAWKPEGIPRPETHQVAPRLLRTWATSLEPLAPSCGRPLWGGWGHVQEHEPELSHSLVEP